MTGQHTLLHSEAYSLPDHRSSQTFYPRDLQRLPQACSPQSYARQPFYGDTFSLGNHIGGVQIENAACKAQNGLRIAEERIRKSWWDTCLAVTHEDT